MRGSQRDQSQYSSVAAVCGGSFSGLRLCYWHILAVYYPDGSAHPNPANLTLVVGNDQAKWAFFLCQSLAIATIRQQDQLLRRGWVKFEQRKAHAISVGCFNDYHRRGARPAQIL